jgi:hypothetical protein
MSIAAGVYVAVFFAKNDKGDIMQQAYANCPLSVQNGKCFLECLSEGFDLEGNNRSLTFAGNVGTVKGDGTMQVNGVGHNVAYTLVADPNAKTVTWSVVDVTSRAVLWQGGLSHVTHLYSSPVAAPAT